MEGMLDCIYYDPVSETFEKESYAPEDDDGDDYISTDTADYEYARSDEGIIADEEVEPRTEVCYNVVSEMYESIPTSYFTSEELLHNYDYDEDV
jgi:hypothetical protein